LGALLADDAGERSVRERDDATVACSALAAAQGVWCLRVHEVRGTADAVRVVAAWARAGRAGPPEEPVDG
ncbi:MAG: dihydropteroate synthase, partial [Nocardioidaceae bacterium]|nr:dihydropteroate synthase [Nocardioidaceae bacterium]